MYTRIVVFVRTYMRTPAPVRFRRTGVLNGYNNKTGRPPQRAQRTRKQPEDNPITVARQPLPPPPL